MGEYRFVNGANGKYHRHQGRAINGTRGSLATIHLEDDLGPFVLHVASGYALTLPMASMSEARAAGREIYESLSPDQQNVLRKERDVEILGKILKEHITRFNEGAKR